MTTPSPTDNAEVENAPDGGDVYAVDPAVPAGLVESSVDPNDETPVAEAATVINPPNSAPPQNTDTGQSGV